MEIFREDKETGLQCGVNDNGALFFGDDRSGYNLCNTPKNRKIILNDFKRYSHGNKKCHGFQLDFVIE